MKRLWVIFLALLPLVGSGATAESGERRIVVDAPAAIGKEWLDFALRADHAVSRFLGLKDDAEPGSALRIRVGTEEQSNHPMRLCFSGREFHSEISSAVYSALLTRAATAHPDKTAALPSVTWMAAALASRELAIDPRRPGLNIVDYEPVRASFRAGAFPDVAQLLTKPVPSSSPIPFRLYAMHCDLFATAVQAAKLPEGNPFARILDLEAHERETMAAIRFVLLPALGEGEDLQQWYERVAPLVSRKGSQQSRADEVARRLEELTTVPTLAMNAGEQRVARMRLEELPDRMDDYRIDRQAIGRIRDQVFELSKDAPWLLHDPLYAYMAALDLLGKGKVRAFQRAMRRARTDFEDAVKRERKIEALLDQIEEDYTSPAERFELYFDAVQRTDEDIRQLDPKVQKLLDQAGK